MTSNNVVKTFNGNVAVNGLIIQQGGWRTVPFTFTTGTKASSADVDSLQYTIIGETLFLRGAYSQPNNTGAADGVGTYGIVIPYEVELNMLGGGVKDVVGQATLASGANVFMGSVFLLSETQVAIRILDGTANTMSVWSSIVQPLTTSGITQVSFTAACRLKE